MTTKTKKTSTPVIFVWARSAEAAAEGYLHLLAWNGGNGDARVFERDALDPRVGDVPFFPTMREVQAYLCANPGSDKGCQIPVTEARAWGLL